MLPLKNNIETRQKNKILLGDVQDHPDGNQHFNFW